jgi:hypothetical protein
MNDTDAFQKVRALGLSFDKTRYKCVAVHHKGETLKHYLIKSLLAFIFNELGEPYFCEYPIRHGIFDLFNVERQICYEVETHPSTTIYAEKRALLQGFQDSIDIIIIKVSEFSNDINQAYLQLKAIVK